MAGPGLDWVRTRVKVEAGYLYPPTDSRSMSQTLAPWGGPPSHSDRGAYTGPRGLSRLRQRESTALRTRRAGCICVQKHEHALLHTANHHNSQLWAGHPIHAAGNLYHLPTMWVESALRPGRTSGNISMKCPRTRPCKVRRRFTRRHRKTQVSHTGPTETPHRLATLQLQKDRCWPLPACSNPISNDLHPVAAEQANSSI